MTETVSAILRVLAQGSGFSSLVETTPGTQRVIKLSGAGPGKRALATEYCALRLARHLGLDVPDAVLLQLPQGLPWQVGTDEFYEAIQRSAGLNLGVAFISGATDLKAGDLPSLPLDFLRRLVSVDALLQNADRSVANPNIIRDDEGGHWAIDFGACLLVDRLARGDLAPRLALPANHFLKGHQEIAPFPAAEAASALERAPIEKIVAAIPAAWLDELGLPGTILAQRLRLYAERLRTL